MPSAARTATARRNSPIRSGPRPSSASATVPFPRTVACFFDDEDRLFDRVLDVAGARPREFFARVVCARRVEERDLLEEDFDLVATVWPTLVEDTDRIGAFRALSHNLRATRA